EIAALMLELVVTAMTEPPWETVMDALPPPALNSRLFAPRLIIDPAPVTTTLAEAAASVPDAPFWPTFIAHVLVLAGAVSSSTPPPLTVRVATLPALTPTLINPPTASVLPLPMVMAPAAFVPPPPAPILRT